jgi:hypothetical protein
LSTTHEHQPEAEDLDVEAALFSGDEEDSGVDRRNAEGGAPSSVLVVVVDSNTTTSAVVVAEEEDAALVGGTTSPSATVMRLFRSSLNGMSWRRLTSLV